MNKKTLGIILVVAVVAVVGVVYFVSQGGSKEGAEGIESENLPNGEEQGVSGDLYSSAKEVAAPTDLPSELTSILSEACGEVKLTDIAQDFSGSGGDLLFYIWKNKPTAEKLTSLFKENGYEVETVLGETLLAKKGNLSVNVQWVGSSLEVEQQILVELTKEE